MASHLPPPGAERTRAIAAALPAALAAQDRLFLLYQPRIRLTDGACLWAEALLRWRDPELGPIGPADFIPIAEDLGLIGDITAWVLHASLAQVRAWHAAGLSIGVSVNISATDLADPGLAPRVAAELHEAGLPAGALELELTERIPRDAVGTAAATTAALAAMGVAVAIDDFGTGHSNLADLRTLPVQVVKIDRSFVQNLAACERDRILLAGMASLGASLGCRVVAEGVETAEQLALVARLGCHEAQGYVIARPMPAGDLAGWVARRG